ncbi:MAG TPA: ATP synthase F0 subunit C [Candidatus Acutalibacter stercorigallinarum]|nr:ATP synthase F0 subunit C [Candidatus Acutalibacter stercorigallinarum]
MKKVRFLVILTVIAILMTLLAVPALAAADTTAAPADTAQTTEAAPADNGGSTAGTKALAVGMAIGLAAAGGAIGMGMVGGKAADGISRQPEMESKIRTSLMLTMVFIETAIIYALLVVILVIFVL